jgi:hypothetical protein
MQPARRPKATKRPSAVDAADLPAKEDLTAFFSGEEQGGGSQVPGRALVPAEALIGMPQLQPMLEGRPHSSYAVHASNPNASCQPVLYMNKSGKVKSFPEENGDFRTLAGDYMNANMIMSFLMGDGCGSMWDSLSSVGGLQGTATTTKPGRHMGLLGGVLHMLEAGNTFRRWLYYHEERWGKIMFTRPVADTLGPPGFSRHASKEENKLAVRKALWAWAFGPEEQLPTEAAMAAMGGPVKPEEMYALARKLWGLLEPAP